MKPILRFKQMPDPLSRFQIVETEVIGMVKGESVLDPYPWFYDGRYAVTIEFQDGRVYKNKEAVNLYGESL